MRSKNIYRGVVSVSLFMCILCVSSFIILFVVEIRCNKKEYIITRDRRVDVPANVLVCVL